MSKNLAVAILFAALASAGAFAAGARRAQAQPPAPAAQAGPSAQFELIAGDRDTAVYFLRNQGQTCYVATTRAGAGISISCPK